MTKSLPLSTFRVQIEALCENPQELIVTEEGQPLFTLLPYEMYQSLLETLDIVADSQAMSILQQHLAELKTGRVLKAHALNDCSGTYQVLLTDSAQEILQQMDSQSFDHISESLKGLSHEPVSKGKALVGSLKGYRSLKTNEDRDQIIYFVRQKQVVVVFVHSTVEQPNALLLHLLSNT